MKEFAVLAFLLAIPVAWAVSNERWRYLDRVVTYPLNPITNFEWYDTLDTVEGGFEAPLTQTSSSVIGQEVLAAAISYVHETPGSSVVVLHRGKLVSESYPPTKTAERLTNSMSMAKTIISLLIGIAIDEGKIKSIDEPVGNYLPSWLQDQRKTITLRHLLTMASGLRCDKDTENLTSDIIFLHLGTDIENLSIQMPADEDPGLKYEYNNFNTQVLSAVLERATKTSMGNYLSEKLWKPLGAKTAYLWKDKSTGMSRAYCCFFARARDYARIGQMILDDGRAGDQQIVSKEWIDTMSQSSETEPEYGLHIWRAFPEGKRRIGHREEEFLDQSMIYLDGKSIQRIYVLPKYELVIVRVGERPEDWDDSFLPNTLAREVVPTSTTGLRP